MLATVGLLSVDAQTTPPSSSGQQTAAADRIPVRRVVLYKTGVGYFEHVGRIRDSQTVAVDFTSSQLDDVLKSLTTLDLGGGTITGVSSNTEDGLDRRLGALRLPVGAHATRAQFLSALRGARLLVRESTRRIEGRLLSVEQVRREADGGAAMTDVVSLITDDGRMESVALEPGVSVQVLDADLNDEVSRYLGLVASVRDQDLRRLSIATAGTGERDLFVSYVSEVPVWKATYRLVLPETGAGRQPLLQGWAIVDNTIGEDWVDVQLSLVAGAPQSFVQRISQPYYLRRPTVPLPERVQLSPQTHASAIATGAASSQAQIEGRGAGRGDPAFRSGTTVTLDGANPAERLDLLSEMVLTQTQQATATSASLGDLFEYTLTEPITIRKNQSALVPILRGDVTAEKVSLWNPSRGMRNPLRAVWLTNSTAATLDGGTFSVIDGNAFAGEGLMNSIASGERRLLSYAVDLGVVVSSTNDVPPGRITRVAIDKGVIRQQVGERDRMTYVVRNDNGESRDVVIEHRARDKGWTTDASVPAAEVTDEWIRYRITVGPQASASFTVDNSRSVETALTIETITDSQVALYVQDRLLTPALEAALREVLGRKERLAAVDASLASRRSFWSPAHSRSRNPSRWSPGRSSAAWNRASARCHRSVFTAPHPGRASARRGPGAARGRRWRERGRWPRRSPRG
jgi:hypothetical protein